MASLRPLFKSLDCIAVRSFFNCSSFTKHNQTSTFLRYSLRQYTSNSPPFLLSKASLEDSQRKNIALITENGRFTYEDIQRAAFSLARTIQSQIGSRYSSLVGERISILAPNEESYLIALQASWLLGAIAVPLCVTHPPAQLEYYMTDSASCLLLAHTSLASLARSALQLCPADSATRTDSLVFSREHYAHNAGELFEPSTEAGALDRTALLIYTSGSTGKPKGVKLSFRNLCAQVNDLRTAWAWSATDELLHILPLHHMHGLMNCLLTPLAARATVRMQPRFEPQVVWSQMLHSGAPSASGSRVNLFMAVPTVYAKLLEHYDRHLSPTLPAVRVRTTLTKNIRLMVSGSAPLPIPLGARWEQLTGHSLLSRYGMTEAGMITSQPLAPGLRVPHSVGLPLPSCRLRIAVPSTSAGDGDGDGYETLAELDGATFWGSDAKPLRLQQRAYNAPGELLARGDNVFRSYWRKPKATADTFTSSGWFKTGDQAILLESGAIQLQGRLSADIIKSAGYKISALDIESRLLEHPRILECAVLGVEDPVWGERVAALLVLRSEGHEEQQHELRLHELREWCRERMPPYWLPTALRVMRGGLPRNAMGKVNKKELRAFFKSGEPDVQVHSSK